MWDVHNGSCLRSLHCGEPIQVARFVEKSSSIVIVTLQCKFILWNMKNGKCSLCSCESTEIPVSDVSHFSANRHGVVFVSSQNGSVHMFEMRDQSLTCLKLLHAREDSRGLALATSHRNGTIIMSSFQDNTLGVWLLDM
jgi:WD40 repeat protein